LLLEPKYEYTRASIGFVVLCESQTQAEKALELVQRILADLQLQLSPEKTRICSFQQGLEFLGFFLSSHTVTLRPKSIEKFKTKVRELTVRSHNLDAEVFLKLNRVIRGTVNYFHPPFASTLHLFTHLDRWTRKRLRTMKFKRLYHTDNRRMKNKHLRRLGLLSARDLCLSAKAP
jgi:hypothetical protein